MKAIDGWVQSEHVKTRVNASNYAILAMEHLGCSPERRPPDCA